MLYVHEIFPSIQGESTDAGLPCVFIRLFGCNVGCSYCDQPQHSSDRKKMSLDRVISEVRSHKIKYVCITGGEPLLQPDIYPLIYELQNMDYRVSIETSGCVPIEPCHYSRSYKYVMDIKCPSSGVSSKNIFDNLFLLQPKDEVKFVIADKKDYQYAKDIIKKYPISGTILFSPVFDKNMKPLIGQQLIDWMLEDGLYNVRLQVQMHKVIGVK